MRGFAGKIGQAAPLRVLDFSVPASALPVNKRIPARPEAERRNQPDNRVRQVLFRFIVIEILSDPGPEQKRCKAKEGGFSRYFSMPRRVFSEGRGGPHDYKSGNRDGKDCFFIF